jgi:hypothetical protein
VPRGPAYRKENDVILRHRTKSALVAVTALATGAIGLGMAAGPASATPGSSQSWTTPGTYSWTVPADVHTVTIVAEGAKGGDGNYMSAGGAGGRETATIPVVPGETLGVFVGGAATDGNGGSNGGGSARYAPAAGGGGGASDVRQGGTDLADRVVVAGGGGGGGMYRAEGGLGGGTAGADFYYDPGYGGGGPGTAVVGGAGGTPHGYTEYQPATDGAFGIGGDGGEDMDWGGGGGGGWYGGGGGAGDMDGAGGGGGSNYAIPTATGVVSENGVNSGDGSVTITWAPTPTTTTTTTAPHHTTTTTAHPAPRWTCPTWPIRVDRNTLWAVNFLRWVCWYQISQLRNGHAVVTFIVPFGWHWAWTANPHGRR